MSPRNYLCLWPSINIYRIKVSHEEFIQFEIEITDRPMWLCPQYFCFPNFFFFFFLDTLIQFLEDNKHTWLSGWPCRYFGWNRNAVVQVLSVRLAAHDPAKGGRDPRNPIQLHRVGTAPHYNIAPCRRRCLVRLADHSGISHHSVPCERHRSQGAPGAHRWMSFFPIFLCNRFGLLDDASFYSRTASTWTMATPRATWKSPPNKLLLQDTPIYNLSIGGAKIRMLYEVQVLRKKKWATAWRWMPKSPYLTMGIAPRNVYAECLFIVLYVYFYDTTASTWTLTAPRTT